MLLEDNATATDVAGATATATPPASSLARWLEQRYPWAPPTTEEELEELVADIGRRPWLWGDAVRFNRGRRSYVTLHESPDLVIGFFGWCAGQGTAYHDHGDAIGAAFVCSGLLIEDTVEAYGGVVVRERTFNRPAESSFSFGSDYIHRVRHEPSHGVCMSIHAYAPAVESSTDYEVLLDGTLRAV